MLLPIDRSLPLSLCVCVNLVTLSLPFSILIISYVSLISPSASSYRFTLFSSFSSFYIISFVFDCYPYLLYYLFVILLVRRWCLCLRV